MQLLRILCHCGAAATWRRCSQCRGSGYLMGGTQVRQCHACDGSGLIMYCPAGCESSGNGRLTVLVDHDASWTV